MTSTTGGSDDELPPPALQPTFLRAKTVEDQKSESGSLATLVPSFRRQHSFEHTVRPVPILEDGSNSYYRDILRGMGFEQSEIDAAMKTSSDLGVEDLVEVIVASRKKKSEGSIPATPSKTDEEKRELLSPSGLSPKSEEEDEKEFPGKKTEAKEGEEKEAKKKEGEKKEGEKKEEKEKKDEPLTLELGEEEPAEWKCHFCNEYVNSSLTEVCIQCNRSKALCQVVSDDQKAIEAENEVKKKERRT